MAAILEETDSFRTTQAARPTNLALTGNLNSTMAANGDFASKPPMHPFARTMSAPGFDHKLGVDTQDRMKMIAERRNQLRSQIESDKEPRERKSFRDSPSTSRSSSRASMFSPTSNVEPSIRERMSSPMSSRSSVTFSPTPTLGAASRKGSSIADELEAELQDFQSTVKETDHVETLRQQYRERLANIAQRNNLSFGAGGAGGAGGGVGEGPASLSAVTSPVLSSRVFSPEFEFGKRSASVGGSRREEFLNRRRSLASSPQKEYGGIRGGRTDPSTDIFADRPTMFGRRSSATGPKEHGITRGRLDSAPDPFADRPSLFAPSSSTFASSSSSTSPHKEYGYRRGRLESEPDIFADRPSMFTRNTPLRSSTGSAFSPMTPRYKTINTRDENHFEPIRSAGMDAPASFEEEAQKWTTLASALEEPEAIQEHEEYVENEMRENDETVEREEREIKKNHKDAMKILGGSSDEDEEDEGEFVWKPPQELVAKIQELLMNDDLFAEDNDG
jgi:hypothetical protein